MKIIKNKEGGGLLVPKFGHFFMISGYFMIFFIVSFKRNERITGLGVFLSIKRRRLRASLGVRQIPAEEEEEEEKRGRT